MSLLPPFEAFQRSSDKCRWPDCASSATHAVRIRNGRHFSDWQGCETHFAVLYGKFRIDSSFVPFPTDCDCCTAPSRVSPIYEATA